MLIIYLFVLDRILVLLTHESLQFLFQPAIPHQGFEETFDASNGSVVCPQFGGGSPRGQIQCLHLNIFVPKSATAQNLLPVIFYIHGGAFVSGSGGTDMGSPDYLLEKDVIFVSINYRLGLYGFLCTDSPKAPGNIGLKDQLLALRWVKANIDAFGGNPNKVTALGASAGGMSVHLHILSPHEQLFEGAIIQSGPATSPLAFVELDNSVPLRISAALGFDTDNVDEAIDFIASVDVDIAIAAANNIRSDTTYSNEPLTKPCVEKEFEGVERFVTANPNDLKPVKSKDIPIIMGYTSQEMIFLHENRQVEFFDNYTFRDLLTFGFRVDDGDEMADLLRKFYIGDETPNLGLINEITTYASDLSFNHPAERAIKNMMDVEAKAVYFYVFSYEGDGESSSSTGHEIEGVAHVSELLYLLKSPRLQNASAHMEFIDKLTTTWTNFAKYGYVTAIIN